MNKSAPEESYALGRLKNLNNTAEGSNLLPPQVGEFRIPFVTNLKLERTELVDTQTYFTLSWDNVNLTNVDHYAVYVNDAAIPANSPIGPYLVQQSPIRIAITGPAEQRLVFRLQTVLKNGFQSDLNAAPTVTGITLA